MSPGDIICLMLYCGGCRREIGPLRLSVPMHSASASVEKHAFRSKQDEDDEDGADELNVDDAATAGTDAGVGGSISTTRSSASPSITLRTFSASQFATDKPLPLARGILLSFSFEPENASQNA